MKFLGLLLLFIASVGGAKESDPRCALLQKDLQTISYEDFFNPLLTRLCSPAQASHLKDLYFMSGNLYEALGQPWSSEQKRTLWQSLDKIGQRPHSVLPVGSYITDLISGYAFDVKGVGSIIQDAKTQKFMILTAAHVASGTSPYIQIGSKRLPTKVIKVDYDKDLALLEFDGNQESLPLGLTAYGIVGTNFVKNLERDQLIEPDTQIVLDTSDVDTWTGFNLETLIYPSVAVIPTWLKQNLNREMEAIHKSGFHVPRTKSDAFTAPGSFPRGFSGAPILMAYRLRKPSPSSLSPEFAFVLGGVISLSGDQGRPQTVASSVGQIQDFLLTQKKSVGEGAWYRVGPYFMKWSEVKGEGVVYTSPHPVGNGVVAEGLVINRKDLLTPVKDSPLQQTVEKLKLEKTQQRTMTLERLSSIEKLHVQGTLSQDEVFRDWQQYQEQIDKTLKESKK